MSIEKTPPVTTTAAILLALVFPLQLALAQVPLMPSQPQTQSPQQLFRLNGISPSLHACIEKWAKATVTGDALIIGLNLTQDFPVFDNSTNHLVNMIEHCIIGNTTTALTAGK